jgi:hypothetical protein
LVSRPPLPEEGPIQADPASTASEATEANNDQEESGSTSSHPPAVSEEPSLDRKRKRVDELLSSSTSTQRDAPGELSAPNTFEVEIFDVLDS